MSGLSLGVAARHARYTAVACHAPAAFCDCVLLLYAHRVPAQNAPDTAQTASPADAAALHDYESCSFDDGLQIAKIDSLPPGVQQRTINTTEGPKVIHMLAGRRIMFAYGVGGDFFANVKPELLPEATWATEKQRPAR